MRGSSRSRAPSARSRRELVLLAMGFTGPERPGSSSSSGSTSTSAATCGGTASYATNVDGVFVAGDAGRGQSLIVWAIAEGRAAAAAVDTFLTGSTTLPARSSPPSAPSPSDGLISRRVAQPCFATTEPNPPQSPR